MDVVTMQFWSTVLAIVLIDLVLAGDNAIVIALVARNLPDTTRTRAIVWGTAGAVVVRIVVTLLVVWLLRIPGLLLMGGAMLVWIAWRLLVEQESAHEVSAAASFWGAMRTIVVADAIMGLDNVLAVAGAAHGSFMLVVIGLMISVPIMIAGSQLVLRCVDRYPFIIYVGAAVLAWTAAGMVAHEPWLQEFFRHWRWASPLLHGGILLLVLGVGFVCNARRAHVRLSPLAASLQQHGALQGKRLLLALDMNGNALAAARHVIGQMGVGRAPEVHLLYVAPHLPRHVARFVGPVELESFRREATENIFKPVRDAFAQWGAVCHEHRASGERNAQISQLAKSLAVDMVVVGASPHPSVSRMFEDVGFQRLLSLLQVPLLVVSGYVLSRLERIGLSFGLGALLAMLWRGLL